MPGMPTLPFGGGADMPDMSALMGSLGNDPAAMQRMTREMMASPLMQNLFSNPEMMRAVVDSNPMLRQMMEQHPELAHVLRDPNVLRESLNVASNPELMREQMRTTDRAMSNIESHPEGFNMLRRMYETVQEPLMNAAVSGGQTPQPPTSSAPAANATQSESPNTAPLPNPWASGGG